jgi:hypothetical protein
MKMLVVAFVTSMCMCHVGCASEIQSAPNSVDLARERMLESGRRAQIEGTPSQMMDGETATEVLRKFRGQSPQQPAPSLPISLIDGLQGSSQ